MEALLASPLAMLPSWPWLLGAAVLALVFYGFHPLQRWRHRHIPGPPPFWLVGNMPTLIAKGQHRAFLDWAAEYGPFFKVWWGGRCTVVTSEPASLRRMARKSAVRSGLVQLEIGRERRFNEYGILLSTGDAWRVASNAWHPFFSKESLAGYSDLMLRSADRFAAALGVAADEGRVVDMHAQFGTLTLDVVGTTAFGFDFHCIPAKPGASACAPPAAASSGKGAARASPATGAGPESTAGQQAELEGPGTPTRGADEGTHHSSNAGEATDGAAGGKTPAGQAPAAQGQEGVGGTPAQQLIDAIQVIFRAFDVTNLWFGMLFLFPEATPLIRLGANLLPTPKYRQVLRARRTLRSVASKLLQSHRQAADGQGVDATGGKGVAPGSFLALQTRAINKTTGRPFPDDWVTQQGFTFIAAGFETTANALAASVYCLAAHPDKEAKLLAEIDAYGRDRPVGAGDLQAFPYVDAVWREALRLYPPGTIIIRKFSSDLALGPYVVPAGTDVYGDIYSMHYSAEHWRDPAAFLPERFLPGAPQAEGCNPDAWLPFGEGARKCTGYAFATQEGLITLIRLYQQFTFRLTPGQVPLRTQTILTHGPAKGVNVTVHRRE